MTPILFVTWLMKLIALTFAIKNKFKYTYYYLIGNFILDIICHISSNTYKKFSIFLYIASACWLMVCSGVQIDNKPLCYAALMALGSIFSLCMISYSYTIILSFYAASALISLFFLIKSLFKKPNFDTGILMMLNIGCLTEVFIVSSFGSQFYFLINVCNCIFYLAIICVGVMSQRYKNLLKKLLQ